MADNPSQQALICHYSSFVLMLFNKALKSSLKWLLSSAYLVVQSFVTGVISDIHTSMYYIQ